MLLDTDSGQCLPDGTYRIWVSLGSLYLPHFYHHRINLFKCIVKVRGDTDTCRWAVIGDESATDKLVVYFFCREFALGETVRINSKCSASAMCFARTVHFEAIFITRINNALRHG